MKCLGSFSINLFLTTKKEWDAVALWAEEHGYSDLSIGWGTPDHPVGCVNWYDAVKFCNALSELAGLEPVYYDNCGAVYRQGKLDLTDANVQKARNGYRLPEQSEWEYACRAGTETDYYWGDEFVPSPENEYAWCPRVYDDLLTQDVGLLQPNSFGLFDMSGNACEWCFDLNRAFTRVMMGGSVAIDSDITSGNIAFTCPEYTCYETGFRVASGSENAPSVLRTAQRSPYFGQHRTPVTVYPDMSETAVAAKLSEMLCDTPELNEMRQKHTEPSQFLNAYKQLFMHRMQERKLDEEQRGGERIFEKQVDEILRLDGQNIKWYVKDGARDMSDAADKAVYMAFEYGRNGERRFLEKFQELLASFIRCNKAEYDAADEETLIYHDGDQQSWAWNNGFNPSMRSIQILYGYWRIVQRLNPEDMEALDPLVIAQTALFLMRDNVWTLIKDGRKKVFNQSCHSAFALIMLSEIFQDFKLAKEIRSLAEERLLTAMDSAVYPDGAPLEQSFWYNTALLQAYGNLKKITTDESLLQRIREKSDQVGKMIWSFMLPTGDVPPTATCGGTFPPDLRNEEARRWYKKWQHERYLTDQSVYKDFIWPEKDKMIDCLWGDGGPAPDFLNAHYPYGGLSVIRSGWTMEDLYLYFCAARQGSGHATENINDIYLAAYGRPMIVNAGSHSYGAEINSDPSQKDIIGQLDKYQHSSFSRNTITVDGYSQTRLEYGENNGNKFTNPTGYRFKESDEFVYTEGKYSDSYGPVRGVEHHRELYYDKKTRLLFVLDTLTSDTPHTYSQNFGIMPKGVVVKVQEGVHPEYETWGYGKEQIVLEEASHRIYTQDIGAPNLFLYQFGPKELKYELHMGELDPARGWFASDCKGLRYPKADIEVFWKCDLPQSAILTVIETAPDEKSRIQEIKEQQGKVIVTFKNGEELFFPGHCEACCWTQSEQ